MAAGCSVRLCYNRCRVLYHKMQPSTVQHNATLIYFLYIIIHSLEITRWDSYLRLAVPDPEINDCTAQRVRRRAY